MSTSLSTFHFAASRISIDIRQVLDGDFGCYLWPSALVLILWLSRTAAPLGVRTDRCRVLELGSGVGLVGLYIASAWPSSVVTLSDAKQAFPQVVANLEFNVVQNGLQDRVGVADLSWGCRSIVPRPYDLIVGADVFYEPALFDDLLWTLHLHFVANPKAVFLTAYQERSSKRSLTPLLEKYGMKADMVRWEDTFGSQNVLDVLEQDIQIDTNGQRLHYQDPACASVFLFAITLADARD
ncbi:hypothetical protein HDV03_000046 [Kappamyces sp. JEL0829]|nr:hypothetical protein HDV03_000046 [Kappamyces sp. JEL0829]